MPSNVFLYLLVLIISISLHYVLNSVEIVIIIGRVRYDSRATQIWFSLPIGPIKLAIIIITNIIYKTKALRTCISLFLYFLCIIYIIYSKILPSSSRFTCILKTSIIKLVVYTRDRVRVWTCISITVTYIVVIVYFWVRWVGGCVLVYTMTVVVFMNLICLLYLTLFLKYISLYLDIFNSFILINWNVVCYWV